MKKLSAIILSTSLIAAGLGGCANQKTLPEQAIYQQYPNVAVLKKQLQESRNADVPLLSPASFALAAENYEKSYKLAQSDSSNANALAQAGLASLSQAKETAALSSDILEDVLRVRAKAKAANAPALNAQAYAKAEAQLKELASLIEKGKLDKAKAGRAEVRRAYSEIELVALKGSIVDSARDAIASAKQKNIDNIAPKTMALAQEEYRLATNTLDANRGDIQKAELHAKRALWHTERARQVADIIANFENSDFNEEDKVLWYQDQVSRIAAPLVGEVAFNQPNKVVVKGLAAQIKSLQEEQQNTLAALSDAQMRESKITREKDAELLAAKAQSEQEKQRQQAIAAKFSSIQTLFSADEADVYRQSDNVLIRAHGFYFPSGGSEITSANFGLANKIIKAIELFPNSSIVVTGHTDNRGSDALNMKLSQDRADKVAKFLTEVGRFEATRISSNGYGEERPVASNDTDQGRASNRRVEVLIINTK